MNDELKQIKKIYGEEMMHLCRELFPNILEHEGLLLKILTSNIAPTRGFANDINKRCLQDNFKNWIYSYFDVEKHELIDKEKNPFELMREAGYTLYECKTEEDIQSFKHYWRKDEELCTFGGGRLNKCHVFFAVKDNVDEIKREDFKNPQRQDKYGTSVISIQFSHGDFNTLSIKNRYNHTVNNPDATFSNNLENIIPGLTKSFETYYGYNVRQEKQYISNLVSELKCISSTTDNKYYYYNVESDGRYFCENNIIIDLNGEVIRTYSQNKERYILIDQYLIDLKEKTIIKAMSRTPEDSFTKSITKMGKIKDITVTKNNDNTKTICFHYDNKLEVKVEVDHCNSITGYENNYINAIGDGFLVYNFTLNKISLPQVELIGDAFLKYNDGLKSISLPNVIKIGSQFMKSCFQVEEIYLPKVKKIDSGFLTCNLELRSITLPEVEKIGSSFLYDNDKITSVQLPKLKEVGQYFLNSAANLPTIDLPSLEKAHYGFLAHAVNLKEANLPNLISANEHFMESCMVLSHLNAPKLESIGECALLENNALTKVSFPNLKELGDFFLYFNNKIKILDVPADIKINLQDQSKNVRVAFYVNCALKRSVPHGKRTKTN